MGGFFAVASQNNCQEDLFYGTDYHSHLGTRRGGMAVYDGRIIRRVIHDITTAQFRSKFELDRFRLEGRLGIGVISDHEDQPVLVGAHLGVYALVTVSRILNLAALARRAHARRNTHFAELSGGEVNPTELVATLINEGASFEEGIRNAQELIEGSCTLALLTPKAIYVARDRWGRTPAVIGRQKRDRRDQHPGGFAATLETCAFPNLGYEIVHYLGPGEIVRLTPEGWETVAPPLPHLRICAFLWVYFGYPASSYEGINVEAVRNRCGEALARHDTTPVDLVAGIPDSGTGHAIGYATARRLPYRRPFVKYTPTWPRSFMPPDQPVRELIARMKLIPIPEMIRGQRLLFCEDSIVRGTQLRDIIERLYNQGAREVHMRPACPPLVFGCRFLNFSRSRSEMELASRRAIRQMRDRSTEHLAEYADPKSERHARMVECIRRQLRLTSLRYQHLSDLVACIGLPKSSLCTYCWDGCG